MASTQTILWASIEYIGEILTTILFVIAGGPILENVIPNVLKLVPTGGFIDPASVGWIVGGFYTFMLLLGIGFTWRLYQSCISVVDYESGDF